jgi:hypothetical protein
MTERLSASPKGLCYTELVYSSYKCSTEILLCFYTHGELKPQQITNKQVQTWQKNKGASIYFFTQSKDGK